MCTIRISPFWIKRGNTDPSGKSLSNKRLQSTTGPPVPMRSLDWRLTTKLTKTRTTTDQSHFLFHYLSSIIWVIFNYYHCVCGSRLYWWFGYMLCSYFFSHLTLKQRTRQIRIWNISFFQISNKVIYKYKIKSHVLRSRMQSGWICLFYCLNNKMLS